MAETTTPSLDTNRMALGVAGLFLVASLLSIAIYIFYDKWPAGYGGWAATLFGAAGIILFGYHLVAQRYPRDFD